MKQRKKKKKKQEYNPTKLEAVHDKKIMHRIQIFNVAKVIKPIVNKVFFSHVSGTRSTSNNLKFHF